MTDVDASKKKRMTQKQAFLEHGKLPPQAIDLEEAVLGALMISKDAIHNVASLLSPDVFYKEAHQATYEAIQILYDGNNPIDILTVTNKLKEIGKLELVGGAFAIMKLTAEVASASNIEYHSTILVQKHLQRELIRISTETIRDSFEDTTDVFDLIAKADNGIAKVSEISVRGGSLIHISDSVAKSIESAIKRETLRKEGKTSGVPTGLHDLDIVTGGFQPSDLIILAARPSMGKSSVMVKFAVSAALKGTPACIYSLEMSDEKLADNILLSQCDVDKDKFKNGWMSQDDWSNLAHSKDIVSKLPIYIDPNPSVSMRYIKANSRVMNRKGKCGIIFIDYLQLADVSQDKTRNREQEIAQASRQAKIIAKELNVPVILLSQMNRKAEDRAGGRPHLSDLRESGAIEQDADLVMFVYRPHYYGIEEDSLGNSTVGYGELIIAKHRNGPLETVKFRHNEAMTKIYNYTVQQTLQPNESFDLPPTPEF